MRNLRQTSIKPAKHLASTSLASAYVLFTLNTVAYLRGPTITMQMRAIVTWIGKLSESHGLDEAKNIDYFVFG